MTNYRLYCIGLGIVWTALASAAVRGPGSSGGGGDVVPLEARAAWFVGGDPIHYCVEMAPDFGVSPGKAYTALETAIANWKDYISKYGPTIMPSVATKLDLNYVPLSHCDGSEELK